ncbi:MAG: TonB-dependent receptor family protein, partial [Rhodoferax sp.]
MMESLRQATCRKVLVMLLANTISGFCMAADETAALEQVVVTATRVMQPSFDVPMSIDSVGQRQLQDGQLQVSLAEALARIPGIVAQNRENPSQDMQISSRGFGARAGFGVRGLRIYSDGIPATMPDGQSQVSHLDIGSAARLEVLRGPFSSLYGNSSGGVIALFTEDGDAGLQMAPELVMGSYGTRRTSAKVGGDTGTLNYVFNASDFRTDGYRDHSATQRTSTNGKIKWSPGADANLALTLNTVDMPEAQDTLGLSRAAFDANPKQADASAYAFNTRKSAAQQLVGLSYEQKMSADTSAAATLYDGQRSTTQFQAIPVAAQAAATHPGGVVSLTRQYWGVDTRLTRQSRLADAPLTLTTGLSYDNLGEARKGYLNFVGAQTGVQGDLRRDENNQIFSFDQYLQAQWEPTAAWLLMVGARHSSIQLDSQDHYIVGANLDDSGAVRFDATTFVVGSTWRLHPAANLYLSMGKWFETPTM